MSLELDDRIRFQEQCLTEEWPSKELHRRIKEYRDPAGHGGRRFQKPESTEAALRQLIRESEMWHRRYREVWFDADDPAIEFEMQKRMLKRSSELVDEAVAALGEMKNDLEQSLENLQAVRKPKKRSARKK